MFSSKRVLGGSGTFSCGLGSALAAAAEAGAGAGWGSAAFPATGSTRMETRVRARGIGRDMEKAGLGKWSEKGRRDKLQLFAQTYNEKPSTSSCIMCIRIKSFVLFV